MKKKFSSIWRVAVALVLVVSLGMVFAAPAGAVLPAGLSVDVRAFCKSDESGIMHPVGSKACRCIEQEERFYVNAAVTAIDVDVDDVEATITIVSGDAILDPAESETKVLGNIQSCRLGDVWWKLICTGPESVTVQVDVAGDGGTVTASGTKTIKQCVEECEPCVVMEFIEPKDCPYEVEVCQTFGVKVELDTDCDIEGVSATISITDTIYGTPSDAAVLVEGMPDTFYLSDMEAGDSTEVGWTLHCERPEDVLVWVAVDYDGAECEEPIYIEVQQKAPACLTIAWDEPTVDPVQICAGCDLTFLLDPSICNWCDYDAEYVIANLTWTNPSSVDVPFPYTRSIDLIEANSCWEPEPWEVECLEAGTVVFDLEVRGYDAKTGDEIVRTSTRTIEQVDFMVNITTPETCKTFSTEQEFCVRVDLMNCTGDDLTDIPVTISVDPATGATLVTEEDNGVCNGVCPDDWTQLVDLCDCCECSLNWCLECAEPNEDLPITVSVTVGTETYTDTVTVHQELKAHLVAGLASYYQCDPDHLLTPMEAFTIGQQYHVIVPVYNTGEATVYDGWAEIEITGDASIVYGGVIDNIKRPIYGGEMRKARWIVECTGEGDVTIEVVEVGGIDTNTEQPVLEDNICLPCPLEIEQIPVKLTWIEWPEGCIEPCTDFTLKVKVQNWDFDDDLNGVSATLYWTGDVDSVEFADGQPQTVDLDNLLSQKKWKGEVECDTASSGSSITLVDGDAGWGSNVWADYAVEITAGEGAGQIRKITANTSDTLTVDPAWTAPDATSEYCIIQGEWAEATWQMHCKDIGDVDFYFVVSVEDPLMCITSDYEEVCQEVPETCLEIDITSPDMGSFYATGQEFAITAEIRNRGIELDDKPVYWPEEAWNVVAGLNDFGYEGDDPHGFRDGLGHFTIVDCNFPEADEDEDGMTLYDIGNIPAGESAMVTWTVRCDRSGLTAVVAEVDWDNKDVECVHPGLPYERGYEWFFTALQYKFDVHDFLLLWQYPTSHLEVEILTVMPDTTINVSDEFIVTYKVKNTGEADASQVEAILSVTPEGSARPLAGIESGYTQYIGTIPGHGETEPLTWPLHCKAVSESTINITAEGLDEYGWHKKQSCANTGNFFIEGGCFSIEGLMGPDSDPGRGWTYGVWVGDANGLTGPLSIDSTISVAGIGGGGPDLLGRLVAQGYIIPHVGTFAGWEIEDLCGDCCNLLDLLGDVEGEDVMIFAGHYTTEVDIGTYMLDICVVGGLFEVINGKITGATVLDVMDEDGDGVLSFLGGEYCSSMAAEAGLPIDPRFIEDAWVTVKQLEADADLAVTKTVNVSEPVEIGTEVTFTVTVENLLGPADATGVRVTDLLPSGVNYVSSDPDQGWYDVTSGTWNVGDLAVGASVELDITVTVNMVGDISNIATITAADQGDPTTTNNADMAMVTGEAAPPVETVALAVGYNLISLPLIPEDPDIEELLFGLDVEAVAHYTGGPAGDWLTYWPADPGISDLFFMYDGRGYWMNMNTAGTLIFDGWELVAETDPPSVPPSYDVLEGWNLIGFKSTTPKPAAEYLAGIAGNYVIIYGYDAGFFIAGAPGHEYLEPGLGYWIAMTEPGTIYP